MDKKYIQYLEEIISYLFVEVNKFLGILKGIRSSLRRMQARLLNRKKHLFSCFIALIPFLEILE